MSVVITGANGYVGSIIAAGLPVDVDVTRLVRQPSEKTDMRWSLDETNAGLAEGLSTVGATDLIHVAWDMTTSGASEAERICVDGSLRLLQAARQAKVSRIIFISTISSFDDARSVYGQAKRVVEREVLRTGGVVFRLGLVHGQAEGAPDSGMLGKIRHAVRTARFIPMIGGGTGLQYCLDASRLQRAIARALAGEFDNVGQPITLADLMPVTFRTLVCRIAAEEGRRPVLVPVPWYPLFLGLRALEAVGFRTPVRSDSVVSFVFSNPSPDFSEAQKYHL